MWVLETRPWFPAGAVSIPNYSAISLATMFMFSCFDNVTSSICLLELANNPVKPILLPQYFYLHFLSSVSEDAHSGM